MMSTHDAELDGWIDAFADKVDLHRHLEGSIPIETIVSLVNSSAVRFSAADAPQSPTNAAMVRRAVAVPSHAALQERGGSSGPIWQIYQECFASLECVRVIAADVVRGASAEGVSLLELRFSPHFMCEAANLEWDAAMRALLGGIDDALQEGEGRHAMRVGLVVIHSRNYCVEVGLRTVEFCRRWRHAVCGFDFAAVEAPVAELRPVVAALKTLSPPLSITVHAGEESPVEYIVATLDELRPQRLGHATSILGCVAPGAARAGDGSLIERLARERVTVEACVTCNDVFRDVISSFEEHPLPVLLRNGVSVCLCTDDPTLIGTTLCEEWKRCARVFDLSRDDLLRMNTMARAASFL